MGLATIYAAIRARFDAQIVTSYDYGSGASSLSKTTVAADGTNEKFTDSAEDLSAFANSKQIVVSGFTESANNGLFTVKKEEVDASNIPVTGDLTTEVAGDTVSIKTALPVLYDGDSNFIKPDNELWVRVHILHTGSEQIEMPGTVRHFMDMVVSIFSPLKSGGTATAEALLDTVTSAFRHATDTGVRFTVPYAGVLNEHTESFLMSNLHCPCYSDESI